MITILIPFCNEIDNISLYGKTLFPIIDNVMVRNNQQYDYVFIDDGSTDDGFEKLCIVLKPYEKNVSLVSRYEFNTGLGCAIRNGIKDVKGEYFIVMDADLSYDPLDVSVLLRELLIHSDADCITASPYTIGTNSSNARIFGSKFFNRIFYYLLDKKVTCVTGMFRLYKTSTIKDMKFKSTGFNINTELMLRLLSDDRKVYEVPSVLHDRKYGISKMNIIKEVINETKLIAKLIFNKITHRKMIM